MSVLFPYTETEIKSRIDEAEGFVYNVKAIENIIELNQTDSTERKESYDRYTTEDVPILDRLRGYYDKNGDFQQDTRKVNNKLVTSYESVIVDTKRGYLFGEDITVNLDKDDYTESDIFNTETFDKDKKLFTDYFKRNSWFKDNSSIGKMAAITGFGARLLYQENSEIEDKPVIKSMSINPWECVWIGNSIVDAEIGIRSYIRTTVKVEKDTLKDLYTYELYDKEKVYIFDEQEDGVFIDRANYPKPHLFGVCPLIGFCNNDEMMGDFEKVETLIDSYNLLMSDNSNSIEEIANAILFVLGFNLDDDTKENIRKGATLINLSNGDENTKAEWLIKDINDTFIKNHLETLHRNIFFVSQTPDMTDENFAGNQSGIAMRYKLLPFENRCQPTQKNFDESLRQEMRALINYWKTMSAISDKCNYLNIEFKWTRNIPIDTLYEAQIQTQLMGTVSDQTRLSLASFISDPEKELEQMKLEEVTDYLEDGDIDGTEPDTNRQDNGNMGEPDEPENDSDLPPDSQRD